MDKKLQDAFEALRGKHGSHGAAARVLGIHRDHYCAMRNGRVNIPVRTADYILLKAQEITDHPLPPPQPGAEPMTAS